jgi:hypothetical protein
VTGQFDPTDFDDSHRQDAKHPELRIWTLLKITINWSDKDEKAGDLTRVNGESQSDEIQRDLRQFLNEGNLRIAVESEIRSRIVSTRKCSGNVRTSFSIEPSRTWILCWCSSFISDRSFAGLDPGESCIDRQTLKRSDIECLYDRKCDS